jgi:ribonuclease-3
MRSDNDGESRLEENLGYHFQDRDLLAMALTPPSSGLSPNNQRLEFLGDAILQGIVSELIYQEKPHWDEGSMSKLRGLLVCTDTLCEWAQELGVPLRRGPRSTKEARGSVPRKPLADAMEALIAAIHLDARQAGRDPQPAVRTFVAARFGESIRQAFPGIWQERDSKTTLQERAAALSLPAPCYELVERGGLDHAPTFSVRAHVGPWEAVATAGTLKGAQMAAARLILKEMKSAGS